MSPAPAAGVSSDLAAVLRRLKLGQMLATLPERLPRARAIGVGDSDSDSDPEP